MKNHKKSLVFITIALLILLFPYMHLAASNMTSIDVNTLDLNRISPDKIQDLKNTMQNLSIDQNKVNSNELDKNTSEKIIEIYKDLSSVVSNEEIADLIEDNKEILSNAGINKGILSSTSNMLKTFDPDTVIDIMENDIDIDEIIEKSESSSTQDMIVSALQNTSTVTKVKVFFKLLLSNGYFRLVFAFLVVLMIYSVFISGILFKKASKLSFRNPNSYLPRYYLS